MDDENSYKINFDEVSEIPFNISVQDGITVVELTGGPMDSEFTPVELTEIAETHLGHSGKIISGSKSGYTRRYPRNLAVFNGNVLANGKKIWYGDLDLSLPGTVKGLKDLALELGQTIHVLYEHDGRFENEDKPQLKRALVVIYPDGKTDWTLSNQADYYHLWHGVPKRKKQEDWPDRYGS